MVYALTIQKIIWQPGAGANCMIEIMFLAAAPIASSDPPSTSLGIPGSELKRQTVLYNVSSAFLQFFPKLLQDLKKMFVEFEDVSIEKMLCDSEGMYL